MWVSSTRQGIENIIQQFYIDYYPLVNLHRCEKTIMCRLCVDHVQENQGFSTSFCMFTLGHHHVPIQNWGFPHFGQSNIFFVVSGFRFPTFGSVFDLRAAGVVLGVEQSILVRKSIPGFV